MVNDNFKKIAIWEGSETFTPKTNTTTKYIKNLNCSFTIKRFLIFYRNSGNRNKAKAIDSNDFKNFAYPVRDDYADVSTRLSITSNNEVCWEAKNTSVIWKYEITRIIAFS